MKNLKQSEGKKKKWTQKDIEKQFLKSFTQVHEHYLEALSVDGTLTCSRLYWRLQQASPSSGPRRAGVAQANMQDFIADVEITAKVELKTAYNDFLDEKITDSMKLRLGRAFIIRGIYPLFKYFKPKER